MLLISEFKMSQTHCGIQHVLTLYNQVLGNICLVDQLLYVVFKMKHNKETSGRLIWP